MNPQEPVGNRGGAPASQGRAGGGPCAIGVWAQARLRATQAACWKLAVGQDISEACLSPFGGEESHCHERGVWGRNTCLRLLAA